MLGWISEAVQITVLACIFYYVFVLFRGTRSVQVLVGLGLLLATLIALTQLFNLDALNWILRRIPVYLAVAVMVIFQPEIRRMLAELGRHPTFAKTADKHTAIDNLVKAVTLLSKQRIGALIAIERDIGTRAVQETGVALDAAVVPELLVSLFFPHAPLHDGGVLIRDNRIVAASCVFPLSQEQEGEDFKALGTRHRAAVGLTEETDAVVIVVSEETGTISVSVRGRLVRDLHGDLLRRHLADLFLQEKGSEGLWNSIRRQWEINSRNPPQMEKPQPEEENSHV